jgi:anti-anti-sigma factor
MEVHIAYPGGGAAIVTMRGQLDVDTAPTLRAAFDELAAQAAPRIIVDLAGLDFCDSVGLSTFVVAHHRCVDQAGWLRLAASTPFLVRLLSIVGVADTVPMYATVDGAQRGDPGQVVEHGKDELVA